jgi:hypothetical protein
VTAALDTYAELRLAEGKLLRWGERATKAACALQPRDLEILVALARYRFLTTGQIAELWWDGRGLRAVRRRMTGLFEAGFVERFRPQTLRGSYQWTYCLAHDGFRAAEQTGELPPRRALPSSASRRRSSGCTACWPPPRWSSLPAPVNESLGPADRQSRDPRRAPSTRA